MYNSLLGHEMVLFYKDGI